MPVDRIIARLDTLVAQGVDFDVVLEAAVQGIHELDPRFHWTGIYELFPDDILRLGPFIGAPTEHVFIGVGQGVCGNVPDVREAKNYLACSSETRSELVVLIRSGDHIWAQIDIDSHDLAAFDDTAEADVQRIADWLASAYSARTARTH